MRHYFLSESTVVQAYVLYVQGVLHFYSYQNYIVIPIQFSQKM